MDVLDAESEFFNAASEEVKRVDALLGQYRQLALSGTLLDVLEVNRNFMAKATTD